MADGQQDQGGQQYNSNDYYLKQQAARMLSAIQKGYNDNFSSEVSSNNDQQSDSQQQVSASMYLNHQGSQQQQPQRQEPQLQQQQELSTSHQEVQNQQLQQQLQQVQQAQQQFQQMQQLAQMQQQFQQYNPGNSSGTVSEIMSPHPFTPTRRGRKPTDRKKRKRHTWVKRPTTAYLYFVSKYRETLKEAGEVVPKAKIITQACAEKWRNMNNDEKEPFLELSRRDRERWQKDKALEKKPKDPNKPKRPPSAYFLFLAEFRKKYVGRPDPAKVITKNCGEAWNNMTDQEKAPYYSDAQVIRAKWERDVEVYKQSTTVTVGRNMPIPPDAGHLEINDSDEEEMNDPSPSGNSLSHINAGILQGARSMMGGMASGRNLEAASSAKVGMSSTASAAMSFPSYNQNVGPGQSGNLQFPGR